MIDFGETYSSPNYEIRDVDGVLANAGTVTATITLPDQTTSNPSVANPSVGIYNFDYTTAQAGRHLVVVSATGGTLGSLIRKFTDSFVVRPADPAMLISLAEAKAHLGEQSDLQDEELRGYVQVATEVIESIAGPCSIRTYTRRIRWGYDRLLLPHRNVTSVTSITSIRTPTTEYLTAALDVDSIAGIVWLANRGIFLNGPWTAVYKAGRSDPPARYVQAVKEQLWHMWVIQRGQLADSTTPDLTDVADFESRGFGLGFLVPRRVLELLHRTPILG